VCYLLGGRMAWGYFLLEHLHFSITLSSLAFPWSIFMYLFKIFHIPQKPVFFQRRSFFNSIDFHWFFQFIELLLVLIVTASTAYFICFANTWKAWVCSEFRNKGYKTKLRLDDEKGTSGYLFLDGWNVGGWHLYELLIHQYSAVLVLSAVREGRRLCRVQVV